MIFDQETIDIFIRLGLAVLLGALIGLERRLAHKTAGMRTFALVCFGSALFSIISQMASLQFINDPKLSSVLRFDPTRIAAQIVTGIGFLGAGLIILRQDRVMGLTTAAGLWTVAAIGMALGFGFVKIAIFSTILVLFILVFLWAIEHHFFKKGSNNEL